MTSLRRSLSPQVYERSMQNGTAFSSAENAVDLSDRSWWSRLFNRRDIADKSKPKGSLWKKPFLPIMVCFIIGFLAGLMPFFSPGTSSFKSEEVPQDFGLEKVFPNHLQREINIGDRERLSDAENASTNTVNSTPTTSLIAEVANSSLVSDPNFGKLLIVVTPTYNRPFQALYLTRLSHTLKLVPPPLLWLVVEMPAQSTETASLLRKTGVMYRHLVCNENLTDIKDRGVHQRNVALAHIEKHQLDGIVYFADDDNIYTLELFEQMRKIKRFGTWPVAMLTHNKSKTILEGPVCDGNKVIGWHTNEKSKRLRRFHVDMSGFAFNSTILWDPKRWGKPSLEPVRQLDTIKEGFQETTFIEQLVEDESQMEGLPSGCSKIMIWHLHLEAPNLVYPPGWTLQKNLTVTIPLL